MAPAETSTARDDGASKRGIAWRAPAIPLAFFVLALGVRLVGLRWGLPSEQRWYSYHPDERDIAIAALKLDFFTGQINPEFYNYPSLFIYLTYVAHTIGAMLGLTNGLQLSLSTLWAFLYDVLLAGRILTVLFGAATVPLVYAISRRAAGPAAGILAAVFIALLPGHVQHSHYATVDVPATFFVTLALWLAIRALTDLGSEDEAVDRRRRIKLVLWSAAVAGLAAATKYNAGLIVVAPLYALFHLRRNAPLTPKQSFSTAGGIIGLALLCFVIGCPGSVLYTRQFLGTGQNTGLLYELFFHSRQGHGDVFVGSGNGWWYHLTFNLPFLMTWPLLVVALAGIGYVLWLSRLHNGAASPDHRDDTRVLMLLLAWIIVCFLTTGLSQVRFMRYMLPLAPALCALGAAAVTGWPRPARSLRGLKLAQSITAASVGIVALLGTYNVLYSLATTDPRDEAATYLRAETTAPVKVGLVEPPWFWSPPLSPQDAPPPRLQSPVAASPDGRFQFVFTGRDAKQLQAAAPEWFVISEFEWSDKERLKDAGYIAFVGALESDYELARSFKHRPPATLPGRNYVPHDFLYPNPEVRIYHRRSTPKRPGR